jgi:hypothetical protein
MRAAAFALGILALAACGKYGPPVRSEPAPAPPTPAVSAAPPAADTEQCQDPNAPPGAQP